MCPHRSQRVAVIPQGLAVNPRPERASDRAERGHDGWERPWEERPRDRGPRANRPATALSTNRSQRLPFIQLILAFNQLRR